jgi:hypothetical protein
MSQQLVRKVARRSGGPADPQPTVVVAAPTTIKTSGKSNFSTTQALKVTIFDFEAS